MVFLASVAACGDRRLVTGIGFTVEETAARSSGFVLDVYYDNGPRYDGILVGSPSRSQEFEHVTVVYGHQTIYEGGRQEGHVTVGEGRIMTYHAVLDGQPTTRDFSDLLRPIAGWGWEIVAPERRPYGTATACPETYDDPSC
ncbi:MAG: hypothetical protein U1F43_32460 [Myxococcota bacterium]